MSGALCEEFSDVDVVVLGVVVVMGFKVRKEFVS